FPQLRDARGEHGVLALRHEAVDPLRGPERRPSVAGPVVAPQLQAGCQTTVVALLVLHDDLAGRLVREDRAAVVPLLDEHEGTSLGEGAVVDEAGVRAHPVLTPDAVGVLVGLDAVLVTV